MFIVILILKSLPISIPISIKVIIEVLIGIVSYFVMLILLGELEKTEIKKLLEDIKSRGRRKYD